jgi:hypothetical protein
MPNDWGGCGPWPRWGPAGSRAAKGATVICSWSFGAVLLPSPWGEPPGDGRGVGPGTRDAGKYVKHRIDTAATDWARTLESVLAAGPLCLDPLWAGLPKPSFWMAALEFRTGGSRAPTGDRFAEHSPIWRGQSGRLADANFVVALDFIARATSDVSPGAGGESGWRDHAGGVLSHDPSSESFAAGERPRGWWTAGQYGSQSLADDRRGSNQPSAGGCDDGGSGVFTDSGPRRLDPIRGGSGSKWFRSESGTAAVAGRIRPLWDIDNSDLDDSKHPRFCLGGQQQSLGDDLQPHAAAGSPRGVLAGSVEWSGGVNSGRDREQRLWVWKPNATLVWGPTISAGQCVGLHDNRSD